MSKGVDMEIKAIGIMGSNTTGTGAAELFLRNGFQVRLYDDFKDSLSIALAKISWSLKQTGNEELMGNMEGIQDLSKFSGADIVIEPAAKSADERKVYFHKTQEVPGRSLRCGGPLRGAAFKRDN